MAGAFAAVERVRRAGVFGVGWWVGKAEGRGEGFVESCDYGFEGGGDVEGSWLGWYCGW